MSWDEVGIARWIVRRIIHDGGDETCVSEQFDLSKEQAELCEVQTMLSMGWEAWLRAYGTQGISDMWPGVHVMDIRDYIAQDKARRVKQGIMGKCCERMHKAAVRKQLTRFWRASWMSLMRSSWMMIVTYDEDQGDEVMDDKATDEVNAERVYMGQRVYIFLTSHPHPARPSQLIRGLDRSGSGASVVGRGGDKQSSPLRAPSVTPRANSILQQPSR